MKKSIFFIVLTCLLLPSFFGGASAAQEPKLKIQVIPARVVNLVNVRVAVEGDHLVVSGKLKKQHEFKLPGHVDVEICSPDGSNMSTLGRVTGYASRRRGPQKASFYARFPVIPTSGSVMRLSYHASGDSSTHNFKCSS